MLIGFSADADRKRKEGFFYDDFSAENERLRAELAAAQEQLMEKDALLHKLHDWQGPLAGAILLTPEATARHAVHDLPIRAEPHRNGGESGESRMAALLASTTAAGGAGSADAGGSAPGETADVVARLAAAQARVSQLEEEAQKLMALYKAKDANLRSVSTDLDSLGAMYDELAKEHEGCTGHKRVLHSQLEDLRTQLDQQVETERQAAWHAAEDLRTQLNQKAAAEESLRVSVTAMQADLCESQRAQAELELELQRRLDSIKSLQRELKESKGELPAVLAKLAKANLAFKEEQAECVSLQGKLAVAIEQVDELSLEVGTVQKMLDLAELDRSQQRSGLARAESELRTLQTECARLSDALKQSERVRALEFERHSMMKPELDALREREMSWDAERVRLQMERARIESALSKAHTESARYRSEATEALAKLESTMHAVEEHRSLDASDGPPSPYAKAHAIVDLNAQVQELQSKNAALLEQQRTDENYTLQLCTQVQTSEAEAAKLQSEVRRWKSVGNQLASAMETQVWGFHETFESEMRRMAQAAGELDEYGRRLEYSTAALAQLHRQLARERPLRAELERAVREKDTQILDAQCSKSTAEAELKRTQAALERTLTESKAAETERKRALAAHDADAWKRVVGMVGPDDFVRTAHRFYAGRVSPKVDRMLKGQLYHIHIQCDGLRHRGPFLKSDPMVIFYASEKTDLEAWGEPLARSEYFVNTDDPVFLRTFVVGSDFAKFIRLLVVDISDQVQPMRK
jgi:chromosome segregation ATPase